MTFSYTVNGNELLGSHKIVFGTFTNTGGSEGGSIETGLGIIENFQTSLIMTGEVISLTVQSILKATFESTSSKKFVPTTNPNGTIEIVTPGDSEGFWLAIGV